MSAQVLSEREKASGLKELAMFVERPFTLPYGAV
jgi:hypothetical protein